jgi:hypothetical protein
MTNWHRLAFQLSSILLIGGVGLAVSGCTASATVTGGSGDCAADSTLVCGAGSAGFSCPAGSLPPASDGSCSDPVANGSQDSYCCLTGGITYTGCTIDTSLSCSTAGSYGFSCTTGSPDPSTDNPSLTCSAPTTMADGTDGYCCTDAGVVVTTCAADVSLVCGAGSTGFSCPAGSAPPASDGSCSDPVANGNQDSYCCLTTTFTGCTSDPSITCTTPGSFGFDCTTGSADPSTVDTSLTCSNPATLPNGDDGYCCTAGTVQASCSADSSLTCAGGSTGYSCPAGSTPDSSAGICSEPVANGSLDSFCCLTDTFTGCVSDPTITCTTPGSFGFDCTTGSASPDTVDTTLTCSNPATLPNGDDGYCCY